MNFFSCLIACRFLINFFIFNLRTSETWGFLNELWFVFIFLGSSLSPKMPNSKNGFPYSFAQDDSRSKLMPYSLLPSVRAHQSKPSLPGCSSHRGEEVFENLLQNAQSSHIALPITHSQASIRPIFTSGSFPVPDLSLFNNEAALYAYQKQLSLRALHNASSASSIPLNLLQSEQVHQLSSYLAGRAFNEDQQWRNLSITS